MAKTIQSTNNALTKKVFDEKLFRDAVKESYFPKFMGGSDSPVHVKTQLTKTKGDKITFGLRMRLSGAGVVDGQVLEGNEESLTTYSDDVTIRKYRHGVRDNGEIDRQRAVWEMDAEARDSLQDWMTEKIDLLCFNALIDGAGTRAFYRASGTNSTTDTFATAKAALTATDKLTPDFISYAKTWAMTGGNRTQPPLVPFRYQGKKYLVMLVHDDAAYDMKQNSTWLQNVRDAMPRGDSHPIFTGALGVHDGVVIHCHENVTIGADAGAGGNVPYCEGALFGAQALCWAWGKKPYTVSKLFDYDEEHGFSVNMLAGVTKTKFNSKDYGTVAMLMARTQISDAS